MTRTDRMNTILGQQHPDTVAANKRASYWKTTALMSLGVQSAIVILWVVFA